MSELQTQLKISYANTPKKPSGDAAVAEQIAATEDEIEYVRKRYARINRMLMLRTVS